tara:strand:+ start:1410 stop:3050 length:1641 start_codon:yes stop_codon:yes gene_type:complete
MATVFKNVNKFDKSQRTLGRVLTLSADKYEDRELVRCATTEEVITYRGMDERSNEIVQILASLGIRRHELVLIMMKDSIELLVMICGLAKCGAVQVPINLAYRGDFLSRLINDSKARTIFIDESFIERLEQVIPEVTNLRRCIIMGRGACLKPLPPIITGKLDTFHFDTLELTSVADLVDGPEAHEMIGVMYTSGTTGASKGVMVSHLQAYRYAAANADSKHVSDGSCYYSAGLPLFHIAGQWGVFYASLIGGATVILRQGYKNEYFWRDIRKYNCSTVFLLGAIANFLWQQAEKPDDSENSLQYAAIYPVMTEHEAFAKRFGVKVSTGYGSTEIGAGSSLLADEPIPNNQCVGAPCSGREVAILGPNDEPLEAMQVGEICFRSDDPWEMMLGYWRQPHATVIAFRNLWLHSGDAGYLDEEGRLYFVDRLGDSMRRRGENISSMEVEDVINRHQSVLECAVFPVWAESEQEVMSAVVLKAGEIFDFPEFIYFLNARMPYFMVPRYVEILDSIPKTPTGKIQKYHLRERGVTHNAWDRVCAGIRLKR